MCVYIILIQEKKKFFFLPHNSILNSTVLTTRPSDFAQHYLLPHRVIYNKNPVH